MPRIPLSCSLLNFVQSVIYTYFFLIYAAGVVNIPRRESSPIPKFGFYGKPPFGMFSSSGMRTFPDMTYVPSFTYRSSSPLRPLILTLIFLSVFLSRWTRTRRKFGVVAPLFMFLTRKPSRRASIISHANSSYSAAGSTQHILADLNNPSVSEHGGLLNPRSATLAGIHGSRDNLSVGSNSQTNLSLSLNYLPSKFSSSIISAGGTRFRKNAKAGDLNLPKRGGGLEAFKSGETRMPQGKRRLRWNKFKWVLFVMNIVVRLYSLLFLSRLFICSRRCPFTRSLRWLSVS